MKYTQLDKLAYQKYFVDAITKNNVNKCFINNFEQFVRYHNLSEENLSYYYKDIKILRKLKILQLNDKK